MNYETQEALDKKVDKWEFHSLKTEIDSLKQTKRSLEEKNSYLENRLQNQSIALHSLIQVITESELFVETNALHEIKGYL